MLWNNKKAKPASNVEIGDHITLILGSREITIEVLSLNEKIRKEEAINLYKIISEKEIKPLD